MVYNFVHLESQIRNNIADTKPITIKVINIRRIRRILRDSIPELTQSTRTTGIRLIVCMTCPSIF